MLLREIEVVQGLRAGTLGEEIEARLRGVTEPSVALVEGQEISPGQKQGKIPEGPRNRQKPQMGEDREAEKASIYPTGTTR